MRSKRKTENEAWDVTVSEGAKKISTKFPEDVVNGWNKLCSKTGKCLDADVPGLTIERRCCVRQRSES